MPAPGHHGTVTDGYRIGRRIQRLAPNPSRWAPPRPDITEESSALPSKVATVSIETLRSTTHAQRAVAPVNPVRRPAPGAQMCIVVNELAEGGGTTLVENLGRRGSTRVILLARQAARRDLVQLLAGGLRGGVTADPRRLHAAAQQLAQRTDRGPARRAGRPPRSRRRRRPASCPSSPRASSASSSSSRPAGPTAGSARSSACPRSPSRATWPASRASWAPATAPSSSRSSSARAASPDGPDGPTSPTEPTSPTSLTSRARTSAYGGAHGA